MGAVRPGGFRSLVGVLSSPDEAGGRMPAMADEEVRQTLFSLLVDARGGVWGRGVDVGVCVGASWLPMRR